MKITIEKEKGGSWEVSQADANASGLTYEEMLGLVAALTMPDVRPCIHWMETEAQREKRRQAFMRKDDDHLHLQSVIDAHPNF